MQNASVGQATHSGGLKAKLRHPNRALSPLFNKADSTTPWFYLPKELWLKILVNYGVSSRDLVSLDRSCRWFSTCWQGIRFINVSLARRAGLPK